ncbi:rho GTPase-activating protein 28 [Polymixia lowei]
MLSPPPIPPPPTSDPQHVTIETYWREVRSIEEEDDEDEEEKQEEEDERKSMDEAELEQAWLTEAGLSSLVTGSSSGEGPAEALLSTLTRRQVAMVKKRLDNYNQTLKKRNKQPIRDVREVFNTMVVPREVLTCIEDLSSVDVTKLGYICLIEVSTFYHALGVQVKRRRTPRTKARDSGVFRVALTTLLENDRRTFPGERVPVVFRKLLSILEQTGLQTEGILRVPCSAARLKFLRGELDRTFYAGCFDWSLVRQQEAAALLKLFIRELPTPLLTSQHLPAYTAIQDISSQVHQVQALHLLNLLLPEENRDTLKALLGFLGKVVSHQDQNRMSLWNVSMVVAPNLFTCNHRSNKRSIARQWEEMEEAVGMAHLVRLLITHQEILWTVPCFLLSQVRQMNQASRTTRIGSLLRKRNHKTQENQKNEVTDLCADVIRVHAPLHSKISMAIQLDGQTRAKDVIDRFQYNNSSGSQCLFEVGGNIGERCLHPDTVLLEVYHVNPHCDWILKPRDP